MASLGIWHICRTYRSQIRARDTHLFAFTLDETRLDFAELASIPLSFRSKSGGQSMLGGPVDSLHHRGRLTFQEASRSCH
jgi:hypothetical protein